MFFTWFFFILVSIQNVRVYKHRVIFNELFIFSQHEREKDINNVEKCFLLYRLRVHLQDVYVLEVDVKIILNFVLCKSRCTYNYLVLWKVQLKPEVLVRAPSISRSIAVRSIPLVGSGKGPVLLDAFCRIQCWRSWGSISKYT